MGAKLLDSKGVYDKDDRDKPKDDQDVCQDIGKSQKEAKEGSRIKKEIEKNIDKEIESTDNLVEVLSTTVDHYFPKLNEWFKGMTDIRDQKVIDYQRETLLWTMLLTLITKQGARRQITKKMRNEGKFLFNLKSLCEQEELESVPHGDTVEYYNVRMPPQEMEYLIVKAIRLLIRGRVLEKFRLQETYYTIAIDGVHLHTFDYHHCDKCTKKEDKKTKKETWYHYKLQASLVTRSGLCLPVLSEWIENEKDSDKQDCEIKALYRLIKKLRKYFPQLPICLLLDALFAKEPVFKAIEKEAMEWMVVFKEGCMSEVYKWIMQMKERFSENKIIRRQEKEIQLRQRRTHEERLKRRKKPVRQTRTRIKEATYTWSREEHWNNKRTYNILTCKEVEDQKTKCDYVWLLSDGLKLNKNNAVDLAETVRCRWKIENEGFNTQKNGGYKLEHCYSRDEVSMKIWSYMLDFAHIINQLIEHGSLIQKELYGSIRNISDKMFEHFCYCVFTKPALRARIQIRLQLAAKHIWWNSS